MHRGKFDGFVTRPDSFWLLYTKVGILYENYPDYVIILYSLFLFWCTLIFLVITTYIN